MMVERRATQVDVVLTSPQGSIRIAKLSGNGVVIKLTGRDDAAFGMIPFDELNHLITQLPRPEIFIDTSAATAVSGIVTDQWTSWLSNNKRLLGTIHILSTGKFFLIAASIMRELSQARNQIKIYPSEVDFSAAMDRLHQKPETSPAPTLFLQSNFSGDETFHGAKSYIRIQRLRPGVLFLTVDGFDDGDTLNEVLSALSAEVENYPGKTRLFIDASRTTGVATAVSDAWTGWIQKYQSKISGVVLLSNNRFITLIVSAAKIFSRTGNLISIAEDQSTFDQRLQQALPQ